VVSDRGAFDPARPGADTRQTVEAGWILYPGYLGPKAQLFTFFTTCGYRDDLQNYNDIQGWDLKVTGWKQRSSTIFPGSVFEPTSVDGGEQHEIPIRYQLYNDNWWLYVKDHWIGYYPAELFRRGHAPQDIPNTLSDHADRINFYGEVFDSDSPDPRVTTTDMGSGEFPKTAWTHSAYIHNIWVQPKTDGVVVPYNGSVIFTSDTSRYDIELHFFSGSNWGSYVYVGGPGRA
jgi:hypothetical protein